MCFFFPQPLFLVFGSAVIVGVAVVGHALGMVSLVLQTLPGGEHADGLVQSSDSVEIAECTFERCFLWCFFLTTQDLTIEITIIDHYNYDNNDHNIYNHLIIFPLINLSFYCYKCNFDNKTNDNNKKNIYKTK